jgi:hypothetical protein
MSWIGMDRDRSALYAAELAAFDGTDLEVVVDVGCLAALADQLVAGEWWPGPAVVVRPARSDARSSTTRCTTTGTTVRVAAGQATIATTAHELAHALAGVAAGHDGTFRAAYLDVISVITNLDPTDRRGRLHVEQLRRSFVADGLDVSPRGWPEPPSAIAGPIAL